MMNKKIAIISSLDTKGEAQKGADALLAHL